MQAEGVKLALYAYIQQHKVKRRGPFARFLWTSPPLLFFFLSGLTLTHSLHTSTKRGRQQRPDPSAGFSAARPNHRSRSQPAKAIRSLSTSTRQQFIMAGNKACINNGSKSNWRHKHHLAAATSTKDTSTLHSQANHPTKTQNATPKCTANRNESRPIALPRCKIQSRTHSQQPSTQPHAPQMHKVSQEMGRGPAHMHHATGSRF